MQLGMPKLIDQLLAIAGAATGSFLTGCGADWVPPERPNVVLVSIDTLRADAISTYGGPVQTPMLDRLAEEGVLFERAYAPAAVTGPSHATLFTGLDIQHHQIVANGLTLPQDLNTLAEAFSKQGYRTGAFVSSFVLAPRFDWDQGFDVYDAEFPEEGVTFDKAQGEMSHFWTEHEFDGFDRRADMTVERAVDWLVEVEEPYFLFVHLFDPHAPYVPPAEHLRIAQAATYDFTGRGPLGSTRRKIRNVLHHYHGEVLFTDEMIRKLMEASAPTDSARSVLTVITSDHGEGLGQHNHIEHSAHLHNELLQVPLIFHWPGASLDPRRVGGITGLVDVAPTIAELAGLPPFPNADGRSFADSVITGGDTERQFLFAYKREMDIDHPEWAFEKHSLVTPRWQYIRGPETRVELYDLEADPLELENVSESEPETVAHLERLLQMLIDSAPGPLEIGTMDEETRRGLRALGYTGYADDEKD